MLSKNKKWKKRIGIVFTIFVIFFLILVIWTNICYKPIKIASAESVDKICLTIENDTAKSYDLEIIEKEDLKEFIHTVNLIKAKKILNGGGGEEKNIITIKVYYNQRYNGKKLGYCVIYGNQILLSEGGKDAYRMSEQDIENLLQYLLQL